MQGYVSNGVTYHNTPEYVNALQAEIARQNGGKTLEATVIYVWLSHEGQSSANATDTNPLNIWSGGKSGSGLEVGKKAANNLYATPEDGIRATAYLILHGPYSGIRATLAPAGSGDPIAQATAIQESPWAASHYGHALVPDVQRLIAKGGGFPGAKPSTSPVGAGAGTVGSKSIEVPASTTETYFENLLHKKPSDPLTAADVDAIIAHMQSIAQGNNPLQLVPFIGSALDSTTAQAIAAAVHKTLDPDVAAHHTFSQSNWTGLQSNIGIAAEAAGNPTKGVGEGIVPNIDWGKVPEQLGTGLTNILDAQNWLYVGALILGLYFAIHGYRQIGEQA